MSYIKEAFDVYSFQHAKNVVLSDDPNNPDKFELETNYLIDVIAEKKIIDETMTVLDFGCGMGRISRELIERFQCQVIGVDISFTMISFASMYVNNKQKFTVERSYNQPNSIDVCISAFVLQHAEDPEYEIENICNVLKPNGTLILLNENKRFVPSGLDQQKYVLWNDDQFDVFAAISKRLQKFAAVKYYNPKLDVTFYRKQT